MLFVGESPPASGRFFYRHDSGLYRAIRDVFRTADASITDENFLFVFQECGCYLIDICGEPVDGFDRPSRRNACLAGEPRLSRRIRQLAPETIISLLRSIQPNVERAAANAGWKGTLLELPYPGRWIRHQEIFTSALLPEVTALLRGLNPRKRFARQQPYGRS